MQLYCLHLKLDHGTEWKKTPADTLAVTEKDEQTIISSLAGISKEICLVLLYLHEFHTIVLILHVVVTVYHSICLDIQIVGLSKVIAHSRSIS